MLAIVLAIVGGCIFACLGVLLVLAAIAPLVLDQAEDASERLVEPFEGPHEAIDRLDEMLGAA